MRKISLFLIMLLALLMPWAANAQQAIPYSYGFEDNNLATDGWTKQTSNSNSGIYSAGSSSSHGGTYVFRFQWNENPGYLISPLLTGTDNGVALEFYYANYNSSYNEKFQVGYTTDENVTNPSAFTYGSEITCQTLAPLYTKYENTFPAGTKRIAIKYIYTNGYYLYLDDFSFTLPASCPKPTDLVCTAYTANTATLEWTENGTATNWVLEYSEDNTFATGVQSVNVSTTPSEQLTDLTADHTYYARVKALCDEDSEWSNTCEFKPSNTVYAVIGTGQTASSSGTYGGIYTYTNSYAYSQQIYTATELTTAGARPGVMQEIALKYAETDASNLTFEVYLGQTTGTSLSSAWISDANLTKVYEGTTTFSGDGNWNSIDVTTITEWEWDGTSNIVVAIRRTDNSTPAVQYPDFYYTSATNMCRYASNSSDNITLNDSYVPSGSGGSTTSQRPDIQFGILPSATPKPRNLVVSNITTDEATISWTAPASATPTDYEFEWKESSESWSDNWTSSQGGLAVQLSGLTASTEYNFRVRAVYAEGTSDPAEISFTTEATCLPVTNITVSDITTTGAKLAWTPGGTETSWQYLTLAHGATPDWTSERVITSISNTNVPANIYACTGVEPLPNTEYDFYVRANCGGGDYSEAAMLTFRTACGIITIDATHQWSEGFESYNEGTSTTPGAAVTEIDCWERVLVNSNTNSPYVFRNYESAASTGLASLELKTGTSPVMVALPEFSAPIQNLNVAFNYNRSTTSSYTYTAELGYISNVDDAMTFVKLFDIPTPVVRSAGHSAYSQDLYEAAAAANAPAGSRVAIRFASSYEYSTYPPSWNFDDFVVSYVSDCHKPTGLAVTDGSITANGATVTWEGNHDSYRVMIGQENLIINANFEGNQIPADFTNSATYPWTTATGGANNSGHCIIPGNQGVHNSDSYLTLAVNLAAPATISFWAKISSESSDYGRFLVDDTQKLNISGNSSYTSWVKYEYELTAGSHTLIWRYHKDSSVNTGDDCFYVDDIVISAGVASWTEYTTTAKTYTFDNLTPNSTYQVKVKGVCGSEETPETTPVRFTTLVACPAPTGLAIVDGYPTAHGVAFTWDYEANEVFQFALPLDMVTDPTQVDFNTTWSAGEDFPIWTDLTADQDRIFWLRKKCGDDEYSDPVSITFHTLEACPAPTGFAVAPNGLTGHTATLNWTGTSESYTVRYRIPASISSSVINEKFEGTTLPDGWTHLGNGTAAPMVSSTHTYDGKPLRFSGATTDNVVVLPEIEGVNTLVIDFWSKAESTTNSGNFDLGYVTDATNASTFVTLNTYSCSEHASYTHVRNYSLASVPDGARIAFRHRSGSTNWYWFIDDVVIGSPVPAGQDQYANNIDGETVTLSGLLAETEYEAWLIGDCGSEGLSNEVGPITFTTTIACPAPTSLTFSNVKSTSVKLSWVSHGEEEWLLEYMKDGEGWITREVRDSQVTHEEGGVVAYNLDILDPETEYCVKVRANCEATYAGDGQSDYSNEECFTTFPSCSVANVTVSDITHHAATVSWDGESADGFTVKYRTAAQIDGLEEEFNSISAPAGWTIMSGAWNEEDGTGPSSTATSGWSFGTNNFSSSHAYMNIYSTWKYWLVTPSITVGSNYVMNFDAAYTKYNSTQAPDQGGTDDRFVVLISTDNKAHWTSLREWNNSGTGDAVLNDLPVTFQPVAQIDLSAYNGQTVYIAFYGASTESNTDNHLRIDNVAIGTPLAPGTEIDVPATDSPANLSSLEAGKKYDVKVVPNCDENLASEWVSFTTVSPNEKWFITEGNWGTATNWEPTGAPTIEQNVTLLANVTIESGCVAEAKSINGTGMGENAKTLTIEDGGKLKHLNSNVRATVKKSIEKHSDANVAEGGYGWYLIANPLTSIYTPNSEGTDGILNGDYDLYSWDYTQDLEWQNYKQNHFTYLSNGAYGYLYANGNEGGTELVFTGTINAYTSYKNRSCSVATNPNNYDFPSWYLLGNPYLYDAYLAGASTNGNALPYYRMNQEGNRIEPADAGTPIGPMEGFFYQGVSGATTAYVVTYVPTVQDEGKLNMTVSQGRGTKDKAIIRFGEGYNLEKFSLNANSTKIYIPQDGKDYAIINTENQGEMPVNFRAEENGTYTLSFTAEKVTFNYLHLIDNMTGTDIDLLATPRYTFTARTTDYTSRFKLVFATGSNSNEDDFAFFSNGNLIINGTGTLQVIDVMGRVVVCTDVARNVSTSGMPAGVYVLRLINGDNVKVQKIVVR